MQITMRFFGQIRQFAGTDAATIDADPDACVNDVVTTFLAPADARLRTLLVDEEGELRRNILAIIRDEVIDPSESGRLSENDEIAFHSALAGG